MSHTTDAHEAYALLHYLERAWANQVANAPRQAPLTLNRSDSIENCLADLSFMKIWFDPVASGRRLRSALDEIGPLPGPIPPGSDQLLMELGEGRVLVTLEGRAAIWALTEAARSDDRQTNSAGHLYISEAVTRVALSMVHETYRDWSMKRLVGVTKLLEEETATMRPTVAGLLLVLLINRNTSAERRLPSPNDPVASAEVSRAIADPALAFARALSGSERASARGLDLYRGWAMGEIARRLGRALHKGDQGIWIDPKEEERARNRLLDAIRDRPKEVRQRVPEALDAALASYEGIRPVLSALGVAHERPSNTRRLVGQILDAANLGTMGTP